MARNSMELLDTDALDLIKSLWQSSVIDSGELFNGDPGAKLGHEAYCDYYRRQWHIFAVYAEAHHTTTAWASPGAIAQLARQIQQGKTWEEMTASMVPAPPVETRDRLLSLAVRLLVMLRVGVTKHQISSRRVLRWDNGSLQQLVHELFSEPPKLSGERVRLPKSFDACNIEKVAGIEISFTDNLADHLLLVEDDSKLLIFHHASFLEYHRGNPNSPFPSDLITETLRTLALLFPQAQFSNHHQQRRLHHIHQTTKRKWLRSLRAKHSAKHVVVDPRLALCGTPQSEDRQIERFRFWRDRLVILKQTYDDATPKTLAQWWNDRRNGVQWYTFWVAILVLIITTLLSLVQAVEGGLQVYKAYVPST